MSAGASVPWGVLQATPPYNLLCLLDILQRFSAPSLEHVAGAFFRRVIRVSETKIAVVDVAQEPNGLNVHIRTPFTPQDLPVLLDKIRHILAIDDPTRQDFFIQAQHHPNLWAIVKPLVGLPAWRTSTVFEALITVIIEQHISWVNAQKAQSWLIAWGGEACHYENRVWYAFPTPARLAHASLEELKPLKITHNRIEHIRHIAQRVEKGTLDLESISTLSPEAAYDYLLSINGVGHWTATVVLARALGYYHGVAHNDVALQAAVKHYFFEDTRRVDGATVQAVLGEFEQWAGLAAFYTLMRWVLDRYPVQSSSV